MPMAMQIQCHGLQNKESTTASGATPLPKTAVTECDMMTDDTMVINTYIGILYEKVSVEKTI